MSQKSVNRDLQIGATPSLFLILRTWAEVPVCRQFWYRWPKQDTERNNPGHIVYFAEFCLEFLLFCVSVLAMVLVVLLSIWCASLSKIRTTWDLLMLIACWVTESQEEVSTNVCILVSVSRLDKCMLLSIYRKWHLSCPCGANMDKDE